MVVPTTSSEYDRLQKWIRENNALKDPATRKLITQQPEETTTTIIEKILDSESDDHVEVVNFEGEHEDDDYDNFGEEIITENEEGISHIVQYIALSAKLPFFLLCFSSLNLRV